MKKILQWLVFGHIHSWKVVEVYDETTIFFVKASTKKVYVSRCEQCGKVKNKRV